MTPRGTTHCIAKYFIYLLQNTRTVPDVHPGGTPVALQNKYVGKKTRTAPDVPPRWGHPEHCKINKYMSEKTRKVQEGHPPHCKINRKNYIFHLVKGRAVNRRPYEPYVWCSLPYWWTFGIVTTVAGIRPVVNRTLPYFDGSQYSK